MNQRIKKAESEVTRLRGRVGSLVEEKNQLLKRVKSLENDKKKLQEEIIALNENIDNNDSVTSEVITTNSENQFVEIGQQEITVNNTTQNVITDKDKSEKNDTHDDISIDTRNEYDTTRNYDFVINRKYININKLCLNGNSKIIACNTTNKANEILNSPRFNINKGLIINTGVNDVESLSPEEIIQSQIEVVKTACKVFPEKKIILSSITLRQDDLGKVIPDINQAIHEEIKDLPNVTHVYNGDLEKRYYFHDPKHLSKRRGIPALAKNIKWGIRVAMSNTTTGDWELYLACIEEVKPWAFAYDRINYARYLIPFLNDMREFPSSKPEVYIAFLNGEFSVQMSHTNTFGGNEADKAIENTINRDCKTGGGYIGFSTNFSATQRWVLNASRRGAYRKCLREHLSLKPERYTHKELSKSRIKKDIEDLEKVIDVLSNILTSPWCGEELISLSSGIEATDAVRQDLLEAKNIGLNACEHFVSNRCSSNPTLDFFDPLKKEKLKTFKNLKKVLNVKTNKHVVPLKMDRNLFARMALLGQFRKIDLKLVFTFPLGPLPWSLSDAYGFPRKTNKSTLLHRLEKDVPIAETYPQHVNTIFDGMAVLQKFTPPVGATFQVLAEKVFDMVTSNPSTRIDVDFDVYKDISIKNAERYKRTSQSDGAKYKNLEAGFQIKSWKSFMAHSSNKVEVVKFLVTQWKEPKFTENLGNKSLYVTLDEKCWKIDSSGAVLVSELQCNHEEADTRIILHAKHAQGPYLVHADDTDVLVLLLCHAPSLHREGYMKMGKGSKSRIIQIHLVLEKLLKEMDPAICSQDFIKSLIGLHAFTGCDSVSSFAGKGKIKALKLLVNNVNYVNGLSNLGVSWDVSDELIDTLEEFVCDLYGKKFSNVNLLRYQLHCARGGKVDPESLPLCRSSLKLHVLRANYQAAVWRRAVFTAPDIPSPHGHGWEVNDDNIKIKWLDSKPAPEEILEMLSCVCKKACTVDSCCCLKAGLKCTDMCLLQCEHMASEDLHNDRQNDDEDEGID